MFSKLKWDFENFKDFWKGLWDLVFWRDEWEKATKALQDKIKSGKKYKEILKMQIRNQNKH